MMINYKDIPEQQIVDLFAWFVKQKDKDMIIHTDDMDIEVTIKKKHNNYDIIDCPAVCPVGLTII